jgi:peptidoglycan hydrolase-like protein with peptidoglycan-binding domain
MKGILFLGLVGAAALAAASKKKKKPQEGEAASDAQVDAALDEEDEAMEEEQDASAAAGDASTTTPSPASRLPAGAADLLRELASVTQNDAYNPDARPVGIIVRELSLQFGTLPEGVWTPELEAAIRKIIEDFRFEQDVPAEDTTLPGRQSTTPPTPKDRSLWMNRQRALEGLGYSLGAVDGIPGKRTKSATRQFQRDWNKFVEAAYSLEVYSAPKVAVDGVWGPNTDDAVGRAINLSNRKPFVIPGKAISFDNWRELVDQIARYESTVTVPEPSKEPPSEEPAAGGTTITFEEEEEIKGTKPTGAVVGYGKEPSWGLPAIFAYGPHPLHNFGYALIQLGYLPEGSNRWRSQKYKWDIDGAEIVPIVRRFQSDYNKIATFNGWKRLATDGKIGYKTALAMEAALLGATNYSGIDCRPTPFGPVCQAAWRSLVKQAEVSP